MPRLPLAPRSAATVAPALALALALAACGEAPRPPQLPNKPAEVAVLTVLPQRVVLTTELPGRVSPTLIAEVRPQVTGIVQSRNFVEGSEVKAGDLLYQIDAASYSAAVDNAQAALAKSQASLGTVQAKAQRYQELVAIKAVSRQEADDAAAALQQAEADVMAARAALQTQRIELARTRIVAPIGGRIGRSQVTPGALVTANQATALATVQRLDPVYVDIEESSRVMLALEQAFSTGDVKRATATVKLLLEDGSSYAWPGRLRFSEVSVDPGTGTVSVRAEFPNPKGRLLPGMYVRAVVEQGVVEQGVLLPQQAVSRDPRGQATVSVVGSDDKLHARPVTLARAIGNSWLIDSGLAAGERVAVEGQQKVAPGAGVVLEAWNAPAAVPAAPASAPRPGLIDATASTGPAHRVALAASGAAR